VEHYVGQRTALRTTFFINHFVPATFVIWAFICCSAVDLESQNKNRRIRLKTDKWDC
jgi:hypothetical protein